MPVAMRPALVLDYTMAASVTETVGYTAIRPFVVYDAHNVCIVADAGSTTTIRRTPAGGVITDMATAIVCAVAGVVTRLSAGFLAAQYVIAVGDVVSVLFTATNSTLNARCWVAFVPTAIVGVVPGQAQGLAGD